MEEQYEYDDFLFTALSIKSKPIVLDNIKQVFDSLVNVTRHNFSLDYDLDINAIESEMKESFIVNEETLGDDVIEVVTGILIKRVIEYFYMLGVTISKDIKISELSSIINSFYLMLTVDKNLAEGYLEIISNEELDTSETFVEILNNFNTIKDERCYELIESVDYKLIDDIKEYLNSLYSTNRTDDEVLNRLIVLDGKYKETTIVKNFLLNGFDDLPITENIDSLYNIIKNTNIDLIPYEITACFILSSDTRMDLENSIYKYFNIDVLNLAPSDNVTIINKVEELINYVEKRL